MKLSIAETIAVLAHKKDKGGYKHIANNIQMALLSSVFLEFFSEDLLTLKDEKVYLSSPQATF